jgi:hypothetical protein
MQDISVLPRFPAKALAKHFGDVGLVVDDQDGEKR